MICIITTINFSSICSNTYFFINELEPFTIQLWSVAVSAAWSANLSTLKSSDNLALYQSNGVASPVLSATNLRSVLSW